MIDDYKSQVLEMDSEAFHGLSQYAYIRGFEDCSDYIGTLGRTIVQDCNGEKAAWEAAYWKLRKEKRDRDRGL